MNVKKVLGLLVVLASMASSVMAYDTIVAVPEIDGSTAVTALGLVAGGLLILRSRRK